ncbi:hypothetical protein C8J57DRAFT_2147 [Mycena rebaudengoi]|nr:hypothetical protein C8J57DRAFT_2147 [Mycena rebaudengoi]
MCTPISSISFHLLYHHAPNPLRAHPSICTVQPLSIHPSRMHSLTHPSCCCCCMYDYYLPGGGGGHYFFHLSHPFATAYRLIHDIAIRLLVVIYFIYSSLIISTYRAGGYSLRYHTIHLVQTHFNRLTYIKACIYIRIDRHVERTNGQFFFHYRNIFFGRYSNAALRVVGSGCGAQVKAKASRSVVA